MFLLRIKFEKNFPNTLHNSLIYGALAMERGEETMSEVHIKDNESLDSALKRFKRNCAKSGVLSDLRKKEYYQSPSVKRRKKSEAARKNKNKRFN